MSRKLEVRLLGKFELSRDGKAITISSRPAQSLFAYLILSVGTSHRREKLAGVLWPDSLEETARENLRHALWRLRKALEVAGSARFLNADDLSIKFEASADYWLDVAELEKLSKDASADQLMSALSNYQGELLPGFYDEWVVLEREHLHSIFEHNMARLLTLLEEGKRWTDILDWGERWIKLGEKPEPAYRALMSAHAAKGDMSKVAATHQRCVNSLKEFGVEPSEQTRALYERLKAGKETLEAGPTVPIAGRRKETPRTNLPVPITSFVGREKEVDQVVQLLSGKRLVTLTGPGGVGKTRLAIQSSKQVLNDFKDGVWWVELAPLMDETLVPQAAAQVLGVRESPGEPLIESVKGFLREKQLLLVLDNCEHLINMSAQFSHDLLTQCGNLRILATSREALDIMGESEYQVQSLSLPAPERQTLVDLLLEYGGIRLFVERAKAKSGFTLTEQNATPVLQICQRLDGIPLALELAAVRTRFMSVDQILERLNDRFNLLTQGNRTALPRHQTLRAAVDWSYDLLSMEEQALFRRLSVFAGGWTLEQSQVICSGDAIEVGRVLDLLSSLVDKSLVIMQEQDGEVRYRMLETIRQYAQEKLATLHEEERVSNRHLDFFVKLAEQAEPKLQGGEQAIWLERLEWEQDNLWTALRWGLQSGKEEGLCLVSALWLFWFMHAHFVEGQQWYREALSVGADASPEIRIRLLTAAASNAFGRGDLEQTTALSEEGLILSRKQGHKWGVAMSLHHLGAVAIRRGDYRQAQALLAEGLLLSRDSGNWAIACYILGSLGVLAQAQTDYEQAGACLKESLILAQEHKDGWLISYALDNLAFTAYCQRDYNEVRRLAAQAITLAYTFGDKRLIASLLGLMGLAALGENKSERATRFISVAESLREVIGSRFEPDEQADYDHAMTTLCRQLGNTAFEGMRTEGRAMTLEQAIEFALQETGE